MLEQVNPWIDQEEIEAVAACLRSGWIGKCLYIQSA